MHCVIYGLHFLLQVTCGKKPKEVEIHKCDECGKTFASQSKSDNAQGGYFLMTI